MRGVVDRDRTVFEGFDPDICRILDLGICKEDGWYGESLSFTEERPFTAYALGINNTDLDV